jgi:hypothetical protein
MFLQPLRLRWLARSVGGVGESTRRFLLPLVVRLLSTHFREFLCVFKGWRGQQRPRGGAAPCFVGNYVGPGRLWDNINEYDCHWLAGRPNSVHR